MLASVNSNLPRVTYLKSIDNFVLVCFGFIFLTSLEYVVAIRFSQNRKAANDRKNKRIISDDLSVSYRRKNLQGFTIRFPPLIEDKIQGLSRTFSSKFKDHRTEKSLKITEVYYLT